MQSPDAQNTHLPLPNLGTLLVRGLVLGFIVGILTNLLFSYTIFLDKTALLLIFRPVHNWQDIFGTITRASEFLVGGMITSIFPGFVVIPAGVLAGGINGILFRWLSSHQWLSILSGAIIGLGVGFFLAWSVVSTDILTQDDILLLATSMLLGALGGVAHSLMLARWG